MVPHITDAIQEWVERVARISVDDDKAEPDICIIEVRSMGIIHPRREKKSISLAWWNNW